MARLSSSLLSVNNSGSTNLQVRYTSNSPSNRQRCKLWATLGKLSLFLFLSVCVYVCVCLHKCRTLRTQWQVTPLPMSHWIQGEGKMQKEREKEKKETEKERGNTFDVWGQFLWKLLDCSFSLSSYILLCGFSQLLSLSLAFSVCFLKSTHL